MFHQLFTCQRAAYRHSESPLLKERLRYETDLESKAKALAHCEIQGTGRRKRWRDDTGLMTFLRAL